MFPNEFGDSLRDQIIKIDQGRRRAEKTRQPSKVRSGWLSNVSVSLNLQEKGTYLTDEQQAELIVQGMEKYNLTKQAINGMITTTSEKAADDAKMRAQKALQNPGLGAISEEDYNLLDPLLQQKQDKAGLSL